MIMMIHDDPCLSYDWLWEINLITILNQIHTYSLTHLIAHNDDGGDGVERKKKKLSFVSVK